MRSVLRLLPWTIVGAAILLAPALWWGRPFIFYDTPAYWGWGRDCLEALLRPWPHAAQPWIVGRPLHGWEIGAHGATRGDLRFTLTLLTARSAFYALPLYLLTCAGGLWLVVILQAWIAAWTLRVAARALIPAISDFAYLAIVAVLTATTSLGFEAGYAMPDLFGGLALLAAGTLSAAGARVSPGARLGLCALMTCAGLVHAVNILILAAAAAFCVLLHWRSGPSSRVRSAAPIAATVFGALALSFAGTTLLSGAFGQPLHMAPFAAGRVLADGAAQPYLRQACPGAGLAACDLAAEPPSYLEYYVGVYPLTPPPRAPSDVGRLYDRMQFASVSDAAADQRDRFVNEQGRLVLGAFRVDGLHEVQATLARGAETFVNFGINPDFDSLAGLLRERTQRRDQIVALAPGAASCSTSGGRSCQELDIGALAPIQSVVVTLAFAFLGLGLVRKSAAFGTPLQLFAATAICLVLTNALLCGALAGPYDRYQSRVEWLVPFAALMQALEWAGRRIGAASAATLRSPPGSIMTEPPARAPS